MRETKDFVNELQLRIDWSEMDLFGHVNNVSFFKYVQAARVSYWEHTQVLSQMASSQKGPMLASSSCQFQHPLFYPGEVRIRTSLEFIKTTSFGLFHQLYNSVGHLVAEAHDVVVFYDFTTESKMEIPANVRLALTGQV